MIIPCSYRMSELNIYIYHFIFTCPEPTGAISDIRHTAFHSRDLNTQTPLNNCFICLCILSWIIPFSSNPHFSLTFLVLEPELLLGLLAGKVDVAGQFRTIQRLGDVMTAVLPNKRKQLIPCAVCCQGFQHLWEIWPKHHHTQKQLILYVEKIFHLWLSNISCLSPGLLRGLWNFITPAFPVLWHIVI